MAEAQEKFIECSRIVGAGHQGMMPEQIAGTPRSQDASAEAASTSEHTGQERGQWNAAMMRDVRQLSNPEGSVPTALDVPG
eukprot:12890403-Prorocentrum_lima.AAC.1